MSGPAALTGPRKRFDSFDQLEEGTKILRRKKKKKKKRSGRNGYNPAWILSFFFFFWKKVPMKVIVRPWSWGALRGPCASQGLTVGMLAQLPPPARITSYCQSRLTVGTG